MNEFTIYALQIGGVGMLGIFLFMLVFYLAIRLLLKIFPGKEKE
jgi:hypothetical protein